MKIKPIIFGVSGTELLPEEIDFFQANPVAGFILFARNVESKEQLQALTASMKGLYPEEVPIFIDQEGGRVLRIKPPIANKLYLSAEELAENYENDPEQTKTLVQENYRELMTELKGWDIDSPCAPVCDIRYEGASDVIGDRAFGYNADQVIDLCKSVIQGILDVSGIPFLKHMPGHGRSAVDSHTDLPTVTTELTELEATDFRVFKELAAEFGDKVWGMTAHIIYTALDEEATATTSPTVINYIRETIGFTGNLVSDDINMGALHGEAGAKYALLQRVIRFIDGKRNWKTLTQDLKNYFDIDVSEFDNETMKDKCHELIPEHKPAFLLSLANVTRDILAVDDSNYYVLHCSGDLEEMRTVCGAVDDYFG